MRENQILLHNRTDSDAICSFASRPFTSSRLSVLTGVCVCVHVCVCACVCQVHEAEHTEAHTVGQTRHNIIIPDIDLVSAELEGKTCTPAVHTRLSRTHRDMCRHTHSRTEKYNLWMHGNTHTHTHKYIELYVHQLSLEPSVMSFWSTSSRNSAKHMPSI